MDAVSAALKAYGDSRGWQARMRQGMEKDYSWRASAAAYSKLYKGLMSQASPSAAA
jgi:starch synthase